MPGYLDQYGAGDERRIRIIKTVVVSVLSVLVVCGILFFVLHNRREEQRVKEFLADLGARDYRAAYALFGCTDATPCTAYSFDQFMQDWGPASGHDPASARVTRSSSCGSGVVMVVDYGKNKQEMLWVEAKDLHVGFPPPGLQLARWPFKGCRVGL
jgi:hypothetical protein